MTQWIIHSFSLQVFILNWNVLVDKLSTDVYKYPTVRCANLFNLANIDLCLGIP